MRKSATWRRREESAITNDAVKKRAKGGKVRKETEEKVLFCRLRSTLVVSNGDFSCASVVVTDSGAPL